MNFREMMDYFNSFPPFSPSSVASGEAAFNLNAIRELLRRIGNPEQKLKFVHIAGTNGKGSTAAYLRSILTEAGYRTGLFTSPYLTHFTEQMTIDGVEIGEEDAAKAATCVRKAADQMAAEGYQAASAYEVTCALAFLYFAEMGCDLVIAEVGLGGRLDATNVIPTPLLAMITSISYDHMEILGSTLEEIAAEKGGIIKDGGEVLLYPQGEAVTNVICGLCHEHQAELLIPSEAEPGEIVRDEDGYPLAQRFFFEGEVYETALLGSYQIKNASMAIRAAKRLGEKGFLIETEAIKRGIRSMRWMGRFELLQTKPCVIVDGSHNVDGAGMLRDNLTRYFPDRRIIFIVGVLADKEYPAMLECILEKGERFYTVTPDSPRALAAGELKEVLLKKGCQAEACDSMEEAVECARKAAGDDGVIVAFGSLYYIGQIRSRFISQKIN